MIASLPMYNRGDAQNLHDRLWDGIRDRLRAGGVAAPDALTRDDDLWAQWAAPDLLLSQACGLPYRTRLHHRVTLVGATDCGLDGCAPGYYRSVFVARKDDPRTMIAEYDGATLARNSADSQSGWGAPFVAARRIGISFNPGPPTGAHRLSAAAVATGAADIAAIDAASWRMILRQDAVASALRVIDETEPTPGLPFITAFPHLAPRIFAAIRASLYDLTTSDHAILGFCDIVPLLPAAYLVVPNPPPFASAA